MASSDKRASRALATVTALALVLALLCLATGAAGKPTPASDGKPAGAASVVEEKTSSLERTSGPADPDAGKKDRKDGGGGKPPKPGKPAQVSATAVAVAPGTPAGRKLHAAGRELHAIGDSCTITVKNACKSRKNFQAAFGYYTFNGVNAGFSGFESQGWYNIRYGKTYRFYGSQPLYVLTMNGLKPSRTSGGPVSFCVSSGPFWILDGDDGYFYTYDEDSNTYDMFDSCYDADGYYRSGFYAPTFCGTTVVYSNC